MQPFSIDLPLPTGPLLVEASAGTGKTWSIARLVARLLAEEPPEGGAPPTIQQILVVTFTEAATAELRDRIRSVLSAACVALTQTMEAGVDAERPQDAGFAALSGTSITGDWRPFALNTLRNHLTRLQQAVRDFDTARISTIHGFCRRVLHELAFESNEPFDVDILKDSSSILDNTVDDEMARTLIEAEPQVYAWLTGPMVGFNRNRLRMIAQKCVASRDAQILPDESSQADSATPWRVRLGVQCAKSQDLFHRFQSTEGQQLRDLFLASISDGTFHGSRMPRATLGDRWSQVADWLQSYPAGDFPLVLTPNRIHAATNARRSSPENALLHAIHDLWAEWCTMSDAVLASFANRVVRDLENRLTTSHQVTFDHLLRNVRAALQYPEFIKTLRSQIRVALIDEFQDTDEVQWLIFRTVFLEDERSRLILIGDPKQAIYAFRNADVAVYVQARDAIPAARQTTMTINHRTDASTLKAVGRLLSAAPNMFLNPQIAYVPVDAHYRTPRLLDSAVQPVAPFELRWFDARISGSELAGSLSNSSAEQHLPRVVARGIAEDLRRGWMRTYEGRSEPVRAEHFAVLTNTNREALRVRDALNVEGIPAIVTASGSVFDTDEAQTILRWLEALAAERGNTEARALAITPLFGFSGAMLVEILTGVHPAATQPWSVLVAMIEEQRNLLVNQGVHAAMSHLLYRGSPPDGRSPLARLARLTDGERRLTNLRHLVERLDEASLLGQRGAHALACWLRDRIDREDTDREEGELRLESDANAVNIVTMHKSKGLEYPIVVLPSLWDGRVFRGRQRGQAPIAFHDPVSGRPTVDLRGVSGATPEHAALARQELLEDRQRLLYVALTRAQHRVVAYMGPTTGSGLSTREGIKLPSQDVFQSPLGLAFFGGASDRPENRDVQAQQLAESEASAGVLRELVHTTTESIGGSSLDIGRVYRGQPTVLPASGIALVPPRNFGRLEIDQVWRRESYSRLVRHRRGPQGQPLNDDPNAALAAATSARDDDDSTESAAVFMPDTLTFTTPPLEAAEPDAESPPTLPLQEFPGGAEAGNWVHEVLERLSFSRVAPIDPTLDIEHLIRDLGSRNGFQSAAADPVLRDALPLILRTMLGGPLGKTALRDLSESDRLNELEFDLPFGNGRGNRLTAIPGRALAECLGAARTHSPVSAHYLDHVRQMRFPDLAGFLNGKIDLVFRSPGTVRPRWYIADYKTNRLGPRDPHTARVVFSQLRHYRQPWMAAEIERKHYYIQYLLYTLAVHRFLRTRVEHYDYDIDFGGVYYLFLRGMTGESEAPDEADIPGVFVDKPPRELVESLDALFTHDSTGKP